MTTRPKTATRSIRRSFTAAELDTVIEVLEFHIETLQLHQSENGGRGNGFHDPDQLAACLALHKRLAGKDGAA